MNPNWASLYDGLISEIKLSHYSPKTLKSYRQWMCGCQPEKTETKLNVSVNMIKKQVSLKCHLSSGPKQKKDASSADVTMQWGAKGLF